MGERPVMSCEEVENVRRFGHDVRLGLSAPTTRLGEQTEVPMDQIIAPKDEKDCPD
jgi:hypothetical protein